LLTADNDAELKNKINHALDYMTGWFSANGLTLNMGNTSIMKFTSSNRQIGTFQITYLNTILSGVDNTRFLGLQLYKHINWKNHIHGILPKLSSACYLFRRMYPHFNEDTLKMIYFAYFHSVMEFGIPFCGFSTESNKILLQQKRILRTMTGLPPLLGLHVECCSVNWEC
jgi:hypothetical protein